MVVLVTGATGTVGRGVVELLVAEGAEVRATSRQPREAALPAGVDVVAADLTRPETFEAALHGVERVFLFPVPDHLDAFLRTAAEAGAQRVVLLSALATTAAPDSAIGRVHAACEAAVERSGLHWTILRPGAFMGNDLNWAPAIRNVGVVRAPYAAASTAPIDERDIAAVAVRALLDAGHTGHRYELSGPEEFTAPRRVRVLGEVLGQEVRFEELSPEEARERMSGSVPPGVIEASLELLASLVDAPADISPAVREITGREPSRYADWAARHADAFR